MTDRPRILVVEDEALSRDMIVRRLQNREFDVEAVSDGSAALDRLERQLPDLVLMDVWMPGMSGNEAVRRIRQRWSADLLPVIMVTAMVDSDDVVAGLEAGANDYVVKPVNFPVLIARMRVALKIKDGVERLLEAERQRVMLQSIDAACNRLSQPLTPIVCAIEMLLRNERADAAQLKAQLRQVLQWSNEAAAVLARLREVAQLRNGSYVEHLGMIDDRRK